MKKYNKKNVVFNPDSEEDMELYKQLQALPYGDFTERTKELWRKELGKEVQTRKIPLDMENDPDQVRLELDGKLRGGK